MKKVNHSKKEKDPAEGELCGNRRRGDRRVKYSEGYVKLNGVGWYCRRSRSRRKGDETWFGL